MIARLIGAGIRAFCVALLVATPALVIPGISSDMSQMIALLALFAAMLTIVEYASTYPSFVEFRDAPPYNRMRFLALALTIFLPALIARGAEIPNLLTNAVSGLGRHLGQMFDIPFSPVRLMMIAMPETAPTALYSTALAMCGVAFTIMLATVSLYYMFVRLMDWPSNNGAFNFWVNLPLFDPTAGGDVLDRLRRDSAINIMLGCLLPFLIPAGLKALSEGTGWVIAQNPESLIWLVLPWAFLPTSLIMRGMALSRIAAMIEEKRRRAYAQAAALHAA